MMDDEASGFSKRKYEKLNDKTRRMGLKKAAMRKRKEKSASKFDRKQKKAAKQ